MVSVPSPNRSEELEKYSKISGKIPSPSEIGFTYKSAKLSMYTNTLILCMFFLDEKSRGNYFTIVCN